MIGIVWGVMISSVVMLVIGFKGVDGTAFTGSREVKGCRGVSISRALDDGKESFFTGRPATSRPLLTVNGIYKAFENWF